MLFSYSYITLSPTRTHALTCTDNILFPRGIFCSLEELRIEAFGRDLFRVAQRALPIDLFSSRLPQTLFYEQTYASDSSMPHKVRHARTEQYQQRRTPDVECTAEGEDDERTSRLVRPSHLHRIGDTDGLKEDKARQESSAVRVNHAKIEISPLPLRRALLSSGVSRNCGPSTPVPSWKIYDSPLENAMELANPRFSMKGMIGRQNDCPQNGVSARKLAASLWEMQGAFNFHPRLDDVNEPASQKYSAKQTKEHVLGTIVDEVGVSRKERRKERKEKTNEHFGGASSLQHCRERFSNPPNHPDRPVEDSQTHRSVSPTLHEGGTKVSCSVNVVGSQSRLEEGSALSCELVKLLNQIWLLEQQHKESTSMVSSLRGELKKTKASIKELQSEQSSYDEDMEMLNKKLADERTALHGRAEEAVLAAIKPFKEELEVERKSKLKLESKYKKLSKEVNEVKRGLTKTMQELEREQKARELMEDVCDELAREIGEDKAQVEELKRQSAKYREEVEQERRMLQMAEVWREERVHMKLAEAKFELEEKNAALDTLRSELEAFLKVKRSLEDGHKNDPSNYLNTEKEAQSFPLHSSVKHVLLGQQSSKDAIAVVSAFEDERRGGHVYENREVDGCFDVNSHSTKLNRVPYPEGLKVPTSIAPGNSDKNAQILFSGNITNEIEENDLHVPSKVHERWHDPSENAVNSGKGLIGQTDNLNRHLTQGKGSAPDVPFFDSYAGGIDAHTELSQHNSKIQNLDGLSDPKQTVPLPLSPTQERTHTWFSVDPYGPGQMNSSMENLKPYKDTSLRARLQEAKLENQQARLKEVSSSAAVEY